MPKCSAFARFAAFFAPKNRLPQGLPKDGEAPRCAVDFAWKLLASNPSPSVSEQLDALRRGAEWSAQDPYLWERRCVPNAGGAGFTVPFVKIGRRQTARF